MRFFEFGSRLQCLLAPLYSKCWLTTSCFSTTTILLCFCSGIKKKLMPEGRWCQINVRRVQLYFYYLAKLGRRTHARNDLNINLLDFILSIDRFICACISFHFIRFFLIFWFKPWQHQLYCVIWFHFSWHLLTDRADHSWKVQFYYDICVCGLHIGQSLRVVIGV